MFLNRSYLFVFLSVSIVATLDASDQNPAKSYMIELRQLPDDQKLGFALKTVLGTGTDADEDLISTVLDDILYQANSESRQQSTIDELTNYLNAAEQGSKYYQWVYVLRARLMMGQPDSFVEAKQQFLTAMKKNWRANYGDPVLEQYVLALLIERYYKEAAIEAYICALNIENAVLKRDFSLITTLYRSMQDGSFSHVGNIAMKDVFPNLPEKEGDPLVRKCAEGICLLIDKQYEEALRLFEDLRSHEPSEIEIVQTYNEYRNLPVYQAAVVFKRDRNLDAAKDYLDTFMKRNRDRPEFVLNNVLGIIETYGGGLSDDPFYSSEFLFKSGFTKDPQVKANVPPDRIAKLLDFYQMGLGGHEKFAEQKKVCQEIVDEYFPEQAGGVNAMQSLAYILRNEGNTQAAEDAFIRIILESRFDFWVRSSEEALVACWRNDRRPVIELLNKIRCLVGLQPQSTIYSMEELETRLKELYASQ